MPKTNPAPELMWLDLYAFAFAVPELDTFADTAILYSAKRLLLVDKKFFKEGLGVQDYLRNPKIKFATLSGGLFFTSSSEIKELRKLDRIVFDPYPDGVLLQVLQGKAQAAFTSPTYYSLYSKKYPLKDQTHMIVDSAELPLALFISKKRLSRKDQEIFRKAVQDMKADGTVRKILSRFLTPEELKKYYTF